MTSFSFSRLFSRKGSRSSSNSGSDKSKVGSSDHDSQKSQQIQSGGTESANSASRHRFDDQGRRYHNRPDAAYMLPNDDEEIDRVHMQHWVIKIAFQGNFHAPVHDQLEKGITVLDAGCGPGTWSLEMAEEYPKSKFHGLDISEVFPTEIKPVNCEFQVHNIAQPLPFPSNHFDFIFQRMVVLGLMRDEWNTALKQYMDAVKPGGWIELTEVNIPDQVNPGPKVNILMNILGAVATTKGLFPSVSFELENKLKQAGAINTFARRIDIPLNHDGKIGALLWEDFCQAFRGLLKPFVIKQYPELADEDAYRKFVDDAGKECQKFETYTIFWRVYGQKPLDA